MWLYHGTYEQFYPLIKQEKVIRPYRNPCDATITLDNLINSKSNNKIRGNCVYLSADKEAMDGFDYSFRISTSQIDVRRLYVANNYLLDFILAYYNDAEVRDKYIQQYLDSFMAYSTYNTLKYRLSKQRNYLAEFLYYGSINLKKKKQSL